MDTPTQPYAHTSQDVRNIIGDRFLPNNLPYQAKKVVVGGGGGCGIKNIPHHNFQKYVQTVRSDLVPNICYPPPSKCLEYTWWPNHLGPVRRLCTRRHVSWHRHTQRKNLRGCPFRRFLPLSCGVLHVTHRRCVWPFYFVGDGQQQKKQTGWRRRRRRSCRKIKQTKEKTSCIEPIFRPFWKTCPARQQPLVGLWFTSKVLQLRLF